MTIPQTRPVRVQRKRSRGWKMPPNTIYVGRPGPWGNPYEPGDYLDKGPYAGITVRDTMHAVVLFREWALTAIRGQARPQENGDPAPTEAEVAASLMELRGKNLACWCPLDKPCHADVLLELANGYPPPPPTQPDSRDVHGDDRERGYATTL